jgi:hypothetical protein
MNSENPKDDKRAEPDSLKIPNALKSKRNRRISHFTHSSVSIGGSPGRRNRGSLNSMSISVTSKSSLEALLADEDGGGSKQEGKKGNSGLKESVSSSLPTSPVNTGSAFYQNAYNDIRKMIYSRHTSVNNELVNITEYMFRDFIMSWYTYISPDEDFIHDLVPEWSRMVIVLEKLLSSVSISTTKSVF